MCIRDRCTLCSVSNNLIINLNNFSSIYNSNIYNILNIINTPTAQILGITPITPYSYTIFVQQVTQYSNKSYTGTFITPSTTIIPINASFILVRADISIDNDKNTVYINGINIPVYNSQISGIPTYPYASIPISNMYNVIITQYSSLYSRSGRPWGTNPLSIRIIGYC